MTDLPAHESNPGAPNAATRREIRFILNGDSMCLTDVAADATLLDHIRLVRRLTGTKEGCAEGDCGACTVLIGRKSGDGLIYEAVNACIRFLGSVDLCHVVTVEHLSRNGALHPVQDAMLRHHGNQCGFCTPGIVMALYALWMGNPAPDADAARVALQGNLCRCTGYAPIVRAAMDVAEGPDILAQERAEIAARLDAMDDGRLVEMDEVIIPRTSAELAEAFAARPDARIVAGGTDVGLWVTKHMRPIAPAIFINNISDLRGIDVTKDHVRIGASVSYSDFESTLRAAFPTLAAYWSRIGGPQVRNAGTIGGNIANGSPIGDTPPILIAADATIMLRKGAATRSLPIADFFIDYGKQDIAPGEFISEIVIPRPGGRHLVAHKISKRRDEDISALALGMSWAVADGKVVAPRIAFGGMAATPRRAYGAERALDGATWAEPAIRAAMAALAEDFAPITDIRASAAYRMRVAQNLLLRVFLDARGDVL